MYPVVLALHSWLRWVVLILGIIALVRAVAGWAGGRAWTRTDDRVSAGFVGGLDLQMLIGVLLYAWLSPLTRTAMSDFAGAMRNASLRFWAVEHVALMLVALVLAHIGRARLRKAATPRRRHQLAAVFFGIALLLIVMAVPWPWTEHARPWLRW